MAGVPVNAPAHLRRLYPGEDSVVIAVDENAPSESFSIETEHGARFVLRASTDEPPTTLPSGGSLASTVAHFLMQFRQPRRHSAHVGL